MTQASMIRKGARPTIRLTLDRPAGSGEYRRVLPFRRSWVAIAVLAAFDIVFLYPAITTFQQATSEWTGIDDLFDLVGALFLTGWLLGWSLAPLLLSTVLALMLFGREVLLISTGSLRIFLGLPLLGIAADYPLSTMRNLRLVRPSKKSGKSWRGPHLAFDFGANELAFGSDLDETDLSEIRRQLEVTGGSVIPDRRATAAELAGEWDTDSVEFETAGDAFSDEAATLSPAPTLSSTSTLLLIIANLVPIAGTLFLGWRLSDVMVLFWAESAVVGFYNILKMVRIGRWAALLGVPFFIGHFGAFMAVHFLFLYGLFVQGPAEISGGDLNEVYGLFSSLWPALAALFLSHGFSYFHNFLGRREYRGRQLKDQMAEPYSRIIFMHLVLIFGGGLTLVLGEPTPVLVLVIGLKVWFDVKAHLKQHAARPETRARPADDKTPNRR